MTKLGCMIGKCMLCVEIIVGVDKKGGFIVVVECCGGVVGRLWVLCC